MTGMLLGIVLLAAQAVQPATLPTLLLPPEADAWVVRIETTGGFTGRGLGNYTASSAGELKCLSLTQPTACPDRLAPETQRAIARLVTAIPMLEGAPAADVPARGRAICNDCVTTTMTVRWRDHTSERTVTYRWDESTLATVPGDVLRLHAAVSAVAAARVR
jgi:hypothetical protein